ncbi:hypothetical protein V6N13_123930 [Hibiscus sabdariffa]|uniref:Uncharacterized protein n=1 Tax=Hibiscus sabdariffa TaxID=183260 RepID=A0ABR2QUU5_9ROSI
MRPGRGAKPLQDHLYGDACSEQPPAESGHEASTTHGATEQPQSGIRTKKAKREQGADAPEVTAHSSSQRSFGQLLETSSGIGSKTLTTERPL